MFFVSDNFDFFTCKVTPGLRDTSKRLSFSQRCSGKWDIKKVVVSVSNMELCISSIGIKKLHIILCPVALHTALNRFMPIFQIALICGRFDLAGNYFT